MPYDTTPDTWLAGAVLTAAQLNAQIRDQFTAAFPLGVDAWTSYTPTLTQSATLTKTVIYAKYQRIGRTIHAQVILTITSSGTAGNPVAVGLPVAAATPHNGPVGAFWYQDTGTGIYEGAAVLVSATTVSGQAHNLGAYIGQAPSITAVNTDVVGFNVTYEAAT